MSILMIPIFSSRPFGKNFPNFFESARAALRMARAVGARDAALRAALNRV